MAGPYLLRRGAAYSVRVRTPSDLLARIGRAEIIRALGTSCPRTARARAAMAYARLQEAWYRIRDIPHQEATPEKIVEVLERALALQEEVAGLDGTYVGDKLLSEDHRRHVQGYVRLFAKVLGDRPLNTFKREDVLRWVRTLEKVRTSYGKGGKDHAKPIEAIMRESRGKPTLGVTTIEKHITHVKGFFTSAIRHHRFATSDDIEAMFGDIRLGKDVPKARERGIWPMEALRTLLASPIWAGTRSRPEDWGKRHEPGPWVHLDAYWWLPVLGLHTGARLEELAQLQHSEARPRCSVPGRRAGFFPSYVLLAVP